MHDLFPGHYRPSKEQFKILWAEGMFVFDTNVLLNIYSYPDSARDAFFSVLQRIQGRVWIPYQVALEFHRNRFARIKQANRSVFELQEKIRAASKQIEGDFKKIEFEKRNTGIKDLDKRLDNVKAAYSKLDEALSFVCSRLPTIGLDDPIGTNIAEIFQGRVGAPPANQDELDNFFADGIERFEKKVPPGFGDHAKQEVYRDRGLNYQAKFGDLILWRQLIKHATAVGEKNVVFVTGDKKIDWWLQDGGQTIGPLPELVQEFHMLGNADRFWMYSADQFLQFASEFLKAEEVTPETIAQVKETADFEHNKASLWDSVVGGDQVLRNVWSASDESSSSEISVDVWKQFLSPTFVKNQSVAQEHKRDLSEVIIRWINMQHKNAITFRSNECQYFARTSSGNFIYEFLEVNRLDRKKISSAIEGGHSAIQNNPANRFSLVLIVPEEFALNSDERRIDRFIRDMAEVMYHKPITALILGYIYYDEFEEITRLAQSAAN